MGLAASSAPEPVGSLLAAAQFICKANAVVNSIDSEKLSDDHHNCTACSTPCQGLVLVDPVLAATIPQGQLVLVNPVSFGALKVNQECGSGSVPSATPDPLNAEPIRAVLSCNLDF